MSIIRTDYLWLKLRLELLTLCSINNTPDSMTAVWERGGGRISTSLSYLEFPVYWPFSFGGGGSEGTGVEENIDIFFCLYRSFLYWRVFFGGEGGRGEGVGVSKSRAQIFCIICICDLVTFLLYWQGRGYGDTELVPRHIDCAISYILHTWEEGNKAAGGLANFMSVFPEALQDVRPQFCSYYCRKKRMPGIITTKSLLSLRFVHTERKKCEGDIAEALFTRSVCINVWQCYNGIVFFYLDAEPLIVELWRKSLRVNKA